jgi:hypothetical protein
MGFGWIWSEIDQGCSGLDTVLDTLLFRAGFAKLVDGAFHVSRCAAAELTQIQDVGRI